MTDNASLREALEAIIRIKADTRGYEYEEGYRDAIDECQEIARAALSTPPADYNNDDDATITNGDLRDLAKRCSYWQEHLDDAQGIRIHMIMLQDTLTRLADGEEILRSPPSPDKRDKALEEAGMALDLARHYVSQAVADGGGIDDCPIEDRLDLERIDHARSLIQEARRG